MLKRFRQSEELVIFFNRISSKIASFYALSFLISSALLFLLTGYILHNSLKAKDQDLLKTKFQEYQSLLNAEGVAGLQLRVSGKSITDAPRFLVRYESAAGQTLFLHVPESMEIVGTTVNLQKLDATLKLNSHNDWIEIFGNDYGDTVEVYSHVLPKGDILQIGKDTEDREDFMQELSHSFFIGLVPVMLLAIFIGLLFSKKLLDPIRWLTQTVQNIRSGKTGERVPLSGNKDELSDLGQLFNHMQDQNEKLVKGMKETLDHVAHDLRTPVMRMQNASQSALKNSPDFNSPLYEALIECQENSETILQMLNAIMDISEVESGTMNLHMEKLEISKLVQNILEIYRFIAEEKNIDILCTLKEDAFINGDKGRLLQAIANIIDNAIKFSPADSVIEISSHVMANEVILEIKDRGPGIPEAEKAKIWERLYRGDQSRSTRGLGLGLSFVQAIMNAHHSRIEVDNHQETGTVFRLIFPSFVK